MSAMGAAKHGKNDLAFISLLRACAALLVVWDHLIGCWFDMAGKSWGPLEAVELFVNRPLGIDEHFGFFGVCLFFFISGFIITHVAQREDRLAFGLKRVLRIYPPLIASVILLPLIYHAWMRNWWVPDMFAHVTPKSQIWSFTLLNYFSPKFESVNAVAWTLAIEVLFYALCLLLLPLVQRRPRLAMAIQLAFVAVVLNFASSRAWVKPLANNAAFLPCLLIGQTAYFLWAKRIRFRDGALFTVVGYVLFVQGHRQLFPDRLMPDASRTISMGFAYAIFIVAMLTTQEIRVPRLLRGVSEISYSLYLLHIYIGLMILFTLNTRVPFEVNIAVTLTGVFGCSYLSWRFIERPSQSLARWLLARRPSRMAGSKISIPIGIEIRRAA